MSKSLLCHKRYFFLLDLYTNCWLTPQSRIHNCYCRPWWDQSDPVIRGWKFKFVLKCVMRRSRIADYGHHFRSDRSRHEKRNSRITILSDLGCPIIVWTQSFTFETESKHSRQMRPVTFGKLDFVLSDYNRDYVVTDFAVSDRNSNNVLYCLDDFWMVSYGTGMIWTNTSLPLLAHTKQKNLWKTNENIVNAVNIYTTSKQQYIQQ